MDENIKNQIHLINVFMFLLDSILNNKSIMDLDMDVTGVIKYQNTPVQSKPTSDNVEKFNMKISGVEIEYLNEEYFCIKYENYEYDVIGLLEELFSDSELENIYDLETMLLNELCFKALTEIMDYGYVTIEN